MDAIGAISAIINISQPYRTSFGFPNLGSFGKPQGDYSPVLAYPLGMLFEPLKGYVCRIYAEFVHMLILALEYPLSEFAEVDF